MTTSRSPLPSLIFAMSLCGLGATALAADPVASTDTVGEASMTIGNVRATSADGTARVLERGAPIRVGDKIETAEGGHVHIRFVDGGRLSVRPLSRLQVEN